MQKIKFKNFLLNEDRAYLGEKIGDILTSIHDLDEEGKTMGMRQQIRFCTKIVSLIRRILHSNWPQTEQKHLKTLQKIGVAIMKGIEEKQDLRELMPSIRQELEQLSSNLGVPVNNMSPDAQEGPSQVPEQNNQSAQPSPETPPGVPPGGV
jgi:hypothetical protein